MSKPSAKASGPALIYLGIAVTVLSIAVIAFAGIMGDYPTAGKAATLIVVGVPVGIIIIIYGVTKTARERKR